MGIFNKISKAFKKVVGFSTGGLIGGHSNSGQSAPEAPAPELGVVDADTQDTTEGKKRGKKSLKVNLGVNSSGRNIV